MSLVHLILKDEVKRALPSGASSIRWSFAYRLDRRPAPCCTSLCCGKTDTARSNGCVVLLLDGFVVESGEADKQAQESVTSCCITRNAVEPHDRCRGAGGTVRSFWEEMHILGICFYPIGAVVIFVYDFSTSLSERLLVKEMNSSGGCAVWTVTRKGRTNERYERRCVVQAHSKVMPFFFFFLMHASMEVELSP